MDKIAEEKIKKDIEKLLKAKKKQSIKWGYVRVSSKEQSEKRQIKELKSYGVDYIIVEKVSGKDFNRPAYSLLKSYCRKGDIIVCTALDRFSRSIIGTFTELEELEKIGVKANFLKEKIDTSDSITSTITLSLFTSLAQIERQLLLERQRQGYEALERTAEGKLIAKTGRVIGAKKKELTPQQLNMLMDFKKGKSQYNISQLAKLLELSRPTVYQKLKEI
ncbi:recombinase family protein [Fusobacterium periodonticum]|uniref:recombinase family protein n=1 Tax=Fusobacterium periodonticum TaxID=860 RepID=UPI00352CEB0F